MKDISLLKGKIHYVGVNDRSTHLFEGMWPIPYGVSYNSYLIDDEKVALIDTVELGYFDIFLQHIKAILGEKPIDYLIVNHMEPDHSANIMNFLAVYPDTTVVGNAKTFTFMGQFFDLDPAMKKLVVKNGDKLELGTHVLNFVLAPMVHWPEVMVTYDATEQVLFSADAFGTYGTVDGGPIDTQINLDKYWDEMVRYYANIVGKYGTPVQKALQKLGALPIQMICSTHGPVWTENISKVIGIYDRLSRYDADKGVVIVYGSMYGHTEQMAEQLAHQLTAKGVKNVVMHNVSKSHPSYILADIFKYNGLIIGSPTYNTQLYPEVEAILSKILMRDIKGRCLGWFGSFSWAGKAVGLLGEFAEKSHFTLVGEPVEMKQGMLASVEEQCEALAEAMAKAINNN